VARSRLIRHAERIGDQETLASIRGFKKKDVKKIISAINNALLSGDNRQAISSTNLTLSILFAAGCFASGLNGALKTLPYAKDYYYAPIITTAFIGAASSMGANYIFAKECLPVAQKNITTSFQTISGVVSTAVTLGLLASLLDVNFACKATIFQLLENLYESFSDTEYPGNESGYNMPFIVAGVGIGAATLLTITMICGDSIIELGNQLLARGSKASIRMGLLLLNTALFFGLEAPWYENNNVRQITPYVAAGSLLCSLITKDSAHFAITAGAIKIMACVRDAQDTLIKDVGFSEIAAKIVSSLIILGDGPLTMRAVYGLAELIQDTIKSKQESQTDGYTPQIDSSVDQLELEDEVANLSDGINGKSSFNTAIIAINAIVNGTLVYDKNQSAISNIMSPVFTGLVSSGTCYMTTIAEIRNILDAINFLLHNRHHNNNNTALRQYLTEDLLPKVKVQSPSAAPVITNVTTVPV
jgi:hypothetical protein